MKQQILDALNWRYATKKFDKDRKILPSDWDTLLESLRLSPSSYGVQPWKFVIVDNLETREKLKLAAWGQEQITSADKLVVLCSLNKFDEAAINKHLENTAKTKNVKLEDLTGYKQMLLGLTKNSEPNLQSWMEKQVYIALGFLLETAALLQIDACPMEGFDKNKFNEILGLDQMGLTSVVVATLGFRSSEDVNANQAKVRYAADEVLVEVK